MSTSERDLSKQSTEANWGVQSWASERQKGNSLTCRKEAEVSERPHLSVETLVLIALLTIFTTFITWRGPEFSK